MQIKINTDRNIEGHEALGARARASVESALSRLNDHITRIEIHLSDDNGGKSGQDDKRCVIEARMEGRQPVAVTHHAQTIEQAVNGAAGKLQRMIESALGRTARREKSPDKLLPEPVFAED